MDNESVVIIGGGPGGYEAALVAAALGAQVSVVERDGVGGAAVLTDCVPSKALVARGVQFGQLVDHPGGIGLRDDSAAGAVGARVDLAEVNDNIMDLAWAQSGDIRSGLESAGVTVVQGHGRLAGDGVVEVLATPQHRPGAQPSADDDPEVLDRLQAGTIILSTGATPRVLPSAHPDGERILTWQQVWTLREVPARLIVIGSGVTGAELAQAYLNLGSEVVLVSSRDRVLPGEDPDAAQVIEDVFRKQGMEVLNRSRAGGVQRRGDEVVVSLEDGREVVGSHALLAVGSVPLTANLGLEKAGVRTTDSGHIEVDRVSRTSARGIYAAGDCTGVLPLASVAASQGRIAIAHALGDAVTPLSTHGISANIFTDPEIATVGIGHQQAQEQDDVHEVLMPLATNARAKMDGIEEGFVKLFARTGSNTLVGGVVVAPRASELIFPIALAVQHRLTLDQVAGTITVYPSLSGSIAEAARRLRRV